MSQNEANKPIANVSGFRAPNGWEDYGCEDIEESLALLQRIKRASRNVFGNSDLGNAVARLCDQFHESITAIDWQHSDDGLTIAFIGATGQGKSWLVRNWVKDSSLRSSLLSGDSQQEATRRLIWIGESPPREFDSRTESYFHSQHENLRFLGTPYSIVDTPGATDLDPHTSIIARRAIERASVIVLVVRRQQLRSEAPARLAEVGDGTLIVPVVTAIRSPFDDPALRTDVDAMIQHLRKVAPHSNVLDAQLVQDFDLSDEDENQIGDKAVEGIAEKLRLHVQSGDYQTRRRTVRLESLRQRFFDALRMQLQECGPVLAQAIAKIENAVDQLPHEIAFQLIGSGHVLRAAIRGRLRAEIMVGTPAIWFPYRTLLSLLSVTQGAWDRVILALSGSLPSLISAAWSSVRRWQEEQGSREVDSIPLHDHCRMMIRERISPIVEQFHSELQKTRNERDTPDKAHEAPKPTAARLVGLENLQICAQEVFENEVVRSAPKPWILQTSAFVASLLFWGLLFAPILALYSTYFSASYETVVEKTNNLDAFPHPTAGMLFTSVLLSILPTSILAMLFLTWAQRHRTQEATAERIESEIARTIQRLQRDGVLRLEFHDPMLEDARCLIRAANDGR